MAKTKTVYVCTNCGEESISWQGRCPVCGEWNTFKEFKMDKTTKSSTSAEDLTVKPLITSLSGGVKERTHTGSGEFDRVLGGGIVPGSVILLGGQPGIGKSTLLMQTAAFLSEGGRKVIYFSGEESEYQVGDRAKRLGLTPQFLFGNQTRIDVIKELVSKESPDLIVIDSIQTLYDSTFPSTPGSLVQVRECALQLQELAKRSGISVILVGHITKEGTVAGPKTLEHMVDVVLYLEGESRSGIRILRGMKNRFGATYEVGLFRLEEKGMVDVLDSSSLFMEEHKHSIPGTALTAVMEGNRPILIEVQALVTPTIFGYPKRTSSGLDVQRLHILLAILESRVHCPLSSYDVFINVVGGYKIQDRSADLGVCLALLAAASNRALPAKQVLYGEVGLTGEIRKISGLDRIDNEVKRLGYIASPSKKTLKEMGQSFEVLTFRKKETYARSESD